MIIAPFIAYAPNGLFDYLQKINGFFNVPIFTIVFMGYITKRVPPKAAKIGLSYFVPVYGISQLFGSQSTTFHIVGAAIIGIAVLVAILVNVKAELKMKSVVLALIYFVLTTVLLSLAWKYSLHFFHISAVLFVFTSFLMKTIGKWNPQKVEFVLKDNNLVNMKPWRGRVKTSAFVLFCMFTMYIIFSPLGIAKQGGADIYTLIALIVLAIVVFVVAKILDKKVAEKDARQQAIN